MSTTTSRTAGRQPANLGSNAALMAVGTLLSRFTGAIRSFVFLGFGATALADAYQIGNTTPNMLYELVAGGVLSATLVPIFVALSRKKTRRAEEGIDAIVTLVGVVLTGTVLLTMALAPVIMGVWLGSASQEKRDLAAYLLRWFAPQIAFYGYITVATALLNARRRFGAPMFAPILNNLTVIVVLIWAQRMLAGLKRAARSNPNDPLVGLNLVLHDTPSKILLGLGTTMGVVIMALGHAPSLRETGYRLRWHWEPRHPAIRELIRLSTWTLGYVVANMVALQFVIWASSRTDGDYAVYSLAYSTFFLLPHGVFAVSIMSGIQPELAEAFLDRKRGRFRNRLSHAITSVLTVMVPAAAGYMILSRPIVALIRNGDLTSGGSRLLADTLQVFALGLPAFSVYLLLMNALKAMRSTKATYHVNVLECALNILFAAIAFRLHFGVQGLAFGMAAAYVISSFLAFFVVSQRTKGLNGNQIAQSLARVFLATAAMVLACAVVAFAVHWLFVRPDALVGLGTRFGSLVEVGAGIGVGVSVYAGVGRRIGITELDAIVRGMQRRLPGFR